MLRQGDVLLVPVASMPAEARPIQTGVARIVLAYGEVTGHAHAIADRGVEILEHAGTRYIRVPMEGARLVHEEHAPIALPHGVYEVRLQWEYRPGEIRFVAD